MKIALLLVAYKNSVEELSHTLDAWCSQKRAPDAFYVVANSPIKGYSAIAERGIILEPEVNLGFAGGVNLAAERASSDSFSHILLSNIDIEMLSDETLARLVQAADQVPDALAISPGISLWPEVSAVWYRGAYVSRPAWISRHPGIGKPWTSITGDVRETGYFSGCCALIDLQRFRALNGFAEDLFMYYDEADLAERARACGWRSYFIDEPLVAHEKADRGLSTVEAFYHARNSARLLGVHERGVRLLFGRIAQAAVSPLQLARCRGWKSRSAYLRGYLTGTRSS